LKKLTAHQIQEAARERLIAELRLFPAVLGPLEGWLDARRQTLLEGVLAGDGESLHASRGRSDLLHELKGLVQAARPEPKGEETDDG
jgi:hypothetical protein